MVKVHSRIIGVVQELLQNKGATKRQLRLHLNSARFFHQVNFSDVHQSELTQNTLLSSHRLGSSAQAGSGGRSHAGSSLSLVFPLVSMII